MSGLRAFGEIDEVARLFSQRENLDVEIVLASGSKMYYRGGEELHTKLSAPPMPVMEPGRRAEYLDFTPVQIKTGHLLDEEEKFIASRVMAPEEFLRLCAQK